MMDQLAQDHHFIENVFPPALARLRPSAVPAWGQMSPVQLVDHLRATMVLSTRDEPRTLSVPEGKLPAMRGFLFSDKPLPHHAPKPGIFAAEEAPEKASFEDQLQQAEEARRAMLRFFAHNPDFSSIHPNFGRLDVTGWMRMHHKHFHHHLLQFGLLPDS